MFSTELIAACKTLAARNNVDPAALLACVEVECNGRLLEEDDRTPRLLFERHIFYRRLAARSRALLAKAISLGLANKQWQRSTQYKDQATSRGRLALIAKARGVHEVAADESASWGMGQTMGFHAQEIGFADATHMVAFMTSGGLSAQVEVMGRNITQMKLWDELQRLDFAGFARRYNGAGYRANQYDTKMAAAYQRWERKLASGYEPPGDGLDRNAISALQQRLRDLGYVQVGKVDGRWGPNTTGALAAFQEHEGLPATGRLDDKTRSVLATAGKKEPSVTRQETTPADVEASGSETIKAAKSGSLWSKLLVLLGIGGGAQQSGVVDQAQDAVGRLSTVGQIMAGAKDAVASVAPYWWVLAIVGGAYLLWTYRKIIIRRVEDELSGVHMGR